MLWKRGQESGGGAAALVAIIALLIVLYVVLLPPSDRADLLADSGSSGGGSSVHVDEEETILQESPGRLDFLAYSEYEHDISPIYLLRSSESENLKTWSAFHVKNGVFDKKVYQTRFTINDLEHTNNLLLSFVVREGSGTLTIRLNGQQILESEIKTFNPDPISLPGELLSSDNILEFEVSSVGWQFWSTNEYIIENMKVIAQITDTSRQESRNVFVIRDMEYFNLDSALLKFNPSCNRNTVGVMEITLNDHLLFSGIPDCGIPNTKEFSAAMLNRGENRVVFKTLEGSYLVDGIMVKTKLKEQNYPLYHFEINQTIWDDIDENRLDVELRLKFLNEPTKKQGIVHVNGRSFSFSTSDPTWDKDITGHVEEDDNWIKIMPDRTQLEVIELAVVLKETD